MRSVKSTVFLALVVVASMMLGACDNSAKVEEANKLINEANALITKNNATNDKVGKQFGELTAGAAAAEDPAEYKTANKAKFDEVLAMLADKEKGSKEAAAKFEAASKVPVGEIFQAYAAAKAQEIAKRGELDTASIAYIKAYLAENDDDKVAALAEEFGKKQKERTAAADELEAKVQKMMKDNPDIFKKN